MRRLGCSKIPVGVRSETQHLQDFEVLGFVPQTPGASPLALASPLGRRGDAARTSRQSRPTHWLLNLHLHHIFSEMV